MYIAELSIIKNIGKPSKVHQWVNKHCGTSIQWNITQKLKGMIHIITSAKTQKVEYSTIPLT